MGKIHYLVKWKGYSKAKSTFEPRVKLIKDIPEMINDFEKNFK